MYLLTTEMNENLYGFRASVQHVNVSMKLYDVDPRICGWSYYYSCETNLRLNVKLLTSEPHALVDNNNNEEFIYSRGLYST